MQAVVVVPPHVFQGRQLDLLDRAPGAAPADQLALVAGVDALGQGVVIRVADGSDRRFDSQLDQSVGVRQR